MCCEPSRAEKRWLGLTRMPDPESSNVMRRLAPPGQAGRAASIVRRKMRAAQPVPATMPRAFVALVLSVLVFSSRRGPDHSTIAGMSAACYFTPRRPPFTLHLEDGYDITVVADGLKRVRFMAWSPDWRLFVTDMFDRSDNRRGIGYVLGPFDAAARRIGKPVEYLTRLRNPNSLAFYTDTSGQSWLYVALTDRLVRYRYRAGDVAPQDPPEVLATFPDLWPQLQDGGWHLTRTIAIGLDHKLYVSVGSSCNACEEKADEARAMVLQMDPDGRQSARLRSRPAQRRWPEMDW